MVKKLWQAKFQCTPAVVNLLVAIDL